MSELRDANPDDGASLRRTIGVLSALGAAAPLALWAFGSAHLGPALAAAVLVGAAGAAAFVRHPQAPAPKPEPQPPRFPTPPVANATPPFAVILERLAEPILLISARDRSDFTARRFLFANAAARELLRIQRPEGPLTTAIRAPEVLAAVDEALFDQVTGHALYQSGGVQDRVWRARATPLETDGESRLVSAFPARRDRVSAQRANANGFSRERQS